MNDKYFTHLKSVMEIVLRELPGANINRVVIALLHDVVEDIPGYSFETLFTIYGDYIANGVDSLSKKDWHDYLSEEEEIEYSNSDVSV
ncbi:hypothetical protein KKG31_00060 [Patescibacteria group bacterium]|nr:hypothetical protein [Patescibacteria group bacterium]MBU1757584.1 hypothetical protein [Patescibacteria group bacterium]MBU1959586.1 hypothetical protein [bacterium]